MSNQDWIGLAIFTGYYMAGAGLIALISHFVVMPKEIVRKSYHIMACASVFVLLRYFEHWYGAVLALALFQLLVIIVIPLAIRIPGLSKLSIQRGAKFGEVIKQAAFFFLSLAILITVIWGLCGSSYKIHIGIGVSALGIGDAAAALIGKRFGKRTLKLRIFDQNKTIEGSMAMAVTTFGAVILILLFFTEIPFLLSLISALILAALSSVIEAITIRGLDTIVIPLVISFSSLGLFLLNTKLLSYLVK